MFLSDLGMVGVDEPFKNLLTQGMVLKDGAKMSKSKGNVVDPDHIIEKYGADTARLFILFAAPPDRDLEWSEAGVEGAYRFVNRVYRLVTELAPSLAGEGATPRRAVGSPADRALRRQVHRTVKKVTEDIGERFQFNTAISSVMELVNAIYAYKEKPPAEQDPAVLREALEMTVLLLAPFSPHLSEELWHVMGHRGSVHLQPWPAYDAEAAAADEIEIVVQVNGRVREKLIVPVDADEESLKAQAVQLPKVQEFVDGKKVERVIVVPGRLVNVVVK